METSLKEKLNNDLKQAMRDGDKVKRSVVRLVLAAIQNAEIAKQATLEDGDVLGIIAKEIRQHQESIDAFRAGNRQDLIDQEEAELKILQEYLPKQMTRDEVVAEAKKITGRLNYWKMGVLPIRLPTDSMAKMDFLIAIVTVR